MGVWPSINSRRWKVVTFFMECYVVCPPPWFFNFWRIFFHIRHYLGGLLWNKYKLFMESFSNASLFPYRSTIHSILPVNYQQCSKLSSSHHLPPPRWHSAPPWWHAHHSPRCPCLLKALPDRPHHLDSSILWAWVPARLSVKSRYEPYHSSERLNY